MTGRFATRWERTAYSVEDLDQRIVGETRRRFESPLRTAYHRLFTTEAEQGDLLVLGIGTGQDLQFAGVEASRITGVDVSRPFIDAARMNFLQGKFHVGRLQDVLPHLPHFPTASASEVLDCIDPPELPDLLKTVRGKTDKLIAVQIFVPDDEFYEFYWPEDNFGSHSDPGIEDWNPDQIAYVTSRLNELGTNAQVSDLDVLLNQIQRMVENNIGEKFSHSLTDIYSKIKFPYKNNIPDVMKSRPYPSQIKRILAILSASLEKGRDSFSPRTFHPEEVADYVHVHTAHRFAQLMEDSTQLEFHLALLEQACRQAGFVNVTRGTISASGDNLVDDKLLGRDINRALGFMDVSSVQPSHIAKINSGVFINGTPMTLFEPKDNNFWDARLQYLIAT